ncbi:MAG: PLDc N-terminal domain-containing protein [Microthrixaceae bacterium]|nr:PLDc N-terminal domain-containing protein [Microthrixaceae bacterium]
MEFGLTFVFFLFFGLILGSMVLWIVALVEVARIPEHQFRAANTEKMVWVLVVALTQWIGALIWWFAKRQDVLAAAGAALPPPPGWYPGPDGVPRWWDGMRWMDPPAQQAPMPPTRND